MSALSPDPAAPALPPSLPALRQRLQDLGAGPQHADRVLRHWVRGLPLDEGGRQARFPARLAAALPALKAQLDGLLQRVSAHPAGDGSERWLMALADGATVETVRLPGEGLCVSSQVGCAVGCGFCMTGREGLQRQLGSLEILAQVAAARAAGPVRKLVFMGMGEPAHNLEAVLEAIGLLGTLGGLGHKQMTFSTVGDLRAFEALHRAAVRPTLALSLHSTVEARRQALLPRAPRLSPAALVEAAEGYSRASAHPWMAQWTLLAGVNDGEDEQEGLVRLLKGKRVMLNLIPWNTVEGLGFRRPPRARAEALAQALGRHGILVKLRDSAGQDVDAGCGQLRARQAQGLSPVRFSGPARPSPPAGPRG